MSEVTPTVKGVYLVQGPHLSKSRDHYSHWNGKVWGKYCSNIDEARKKAGEATEYGPWTSWAPAERDDVISKADDAPFKAGDKVRCVRSGSGVTHGKIYTIKRVDADQDWTRNSPEYYDAPMVEIEEDPGGKCAYRFELARDAYPARYGVGDRVLCIDTSTLSSADVQLGEICKVLRIGAGSWEYDAKRSELGRAPYVKVRRADRSEVEYFSWRFERTDLPEPAQQPAEKHLGMGGTFAAQAANRLSRASPRRQLLLLQGERA